MWLALLKNWKYAAIIGAFAAGWYVNGLRHEINASEAEMITAKESAKQAAAVLAAHQEAVEKLEKERDNALKKYRNAQIEADRLAGAVASGSVSLRVNALCEPAKASGIEPATARLAPDAERAYFSHLNAINEVNKLLDLCGVPRE